MWASPPAKTAMQALSKTRPKIKHGAFQSPPLNPYGPHLDICTGDRALDSGKKCHARLLVNGLKHSTYFSSKLITFYTQCGRISDARLLFDEMSGTDLCRWIVLIGAYSRCCFHQEALALFHEMQSQGIRPNKYIFPSVIRACSNTSDLETGKRIHNLVFRLLGNSDAFIGSALIDMYAKCGRLETARKVFDGMRHRDLVAWNAMVSAYAQQGFAEDAMKLFGEMQLMGVKPDLLTWNALIAGYADVGDEAMAFTLFRKMQNHGIDPDVVSWTSLVSGFVKNFHNGEAFSVFKWMVASGVSPSSVTISSLLPACATSADLRRGKEIHGHALVIGVEEDIFVSSALVDMYAKCGLLFEAWNLFCKMHKRNTVSWNAMIFGYANHGYGDKAIELFEQMMNNKEVKPDHLTFTAVLTACSHAGKIESGKKLFDSMKKEFGIESRLEHYACMVDLLGRAGKLSEAYCFIQEIPIEPDSFVWGALLGACRNHGNVELAEIAASHLSDIEPESAGSSVLLSNIFADAGRWEDAARVKKMAKRRRLQRSPGCSWIESAELVT